MSHRWRKIILALALVVGRAALAWGEPIGTLAHWSDTQVRLLLPSGPRTLEASPELGRKLRQQGLGSRWEVWIRGPRLESARPQGHDAACRAALTTLRDFAQRVNQARWQQAHAQLNPASRPSLESFRTRWSSQFLSLNPNDWEIRQATSQEVLVKIVSCQGSLGGEDGDPSPTTLKSTWSLARSGNSPWWIEER